jgi:DNA/RNA-binding domain of Phe-tRNA-synthetase-like protein
MGYALRVDPTIHERFPGYAVLLLYAFDLHIGPSDDWSVELLRAAESEARQVFGVAKASSHPHVAAWREAFSAFGAKPSKYPSSVEALLSRVLRGQELPTINRVVDLYNAVSIRHVLPVGGEDLDQLTSDSVLAPARGDEPFVAIGGGEELVEFPAAGEVVWADSSGVTCRRWNWRQCRRTQLREDSRNAYFVLDRMAPYPIESLEAAGDDLERLLHEASPGCRIERVLIPGE